MPTQQETMLAGLHHCRVECRRMATSPQWPWRHCIAVNFPGFELSQEVLEGPASNCPLGLWEGIPPADTENRQALARSNGRDMMRRGPMKHLVWLVRGLANNASVEAVRDCLAHALAEERSGLELWMVIEMVKGLEGESVLPPGTYRDVAGDGVDVILAADWGRNDAAWSALRACVEAHQDDRGECLTVDEAQTLANAKGVTEAEDERTA